MKIRDLDLSDNPVNAEHAALGLPPLENAVTHAGDPHQPVLRFAMWSVVFLLMAVSTGSWEKGGWNTALAWEYLLSSLFCSAVLTSRQRCRPAGRLPSAVFSPTSMAASPSWPWANA